MRQSLAVLTVTLLAASCNCPGSGGGGGGNETGGGQAAGGGTATGGGAPTSTGGGTPSTGGGSGGGGPSVDTSVIQHHNHATRDGVYLDPALTKAALATLHRVQTFHLPVNGPTYAQPLFLAGGIGGHDALIVATEQNLIYAFDASSGALLWQTGLGDPVPRSVLPCGNINPLGITGTPYADLPNRRLYFDAMTMVTNDVGPRHLVYALSLDDGAVLPDWPVDVQAALPSFTSITQNQRGAVLLLDGVLYVPYGGHAGDCGTYHGWVVGIDVATHAVTGWATPARGGGIWAVNGVSSDGTSVFATTGNTFGSTTWQGGEAVLRLGKGPVFSGASADYFAPQNWIALDNADLDLGGAAAVLVDAPGSTPSALVLALGKDGKAYLMDRAALGGVGGQLAVKTVATGVIYSAPAVFTTPAGTFIAFQVANQGTGASCPNHQSGNLVTVAITQTDPPGIEAAWCSKETTLAAPVVSVTDAQGGNAILWSIGTQGNNRLFAYDAVTGAELFAGGAAADQITAAHYFMTPIIAKGRVYVAAYDGVYAFAP